MSGVKRSAFEIQQERAAKLKLVGEANNLRGELSGMKGQIRQTIDRASEGLRSTFEELVRRAEEYLQNTTIPQDKWDSDTDPAVLKKAKDDLSRSVSHANTVDKELTAAFGEKADQMGRQLAGKLADVERVLSGRRELLALWVADTERNAWDKALADNREKLDEQAYSSVGVALRVLMAELQSRIDIAESQEAKHQQRLYVLNAINKVCRQRGFQRVEGPRLDDENDRGSRISMTFDTMAKGRIQFSLTLEGIHADSEISGASCFEDFDALSDSLSEMFGIDTEFRRPDGTRPEDIELKGHGTQQGRKVTRTQRSTGRGA